MRKGIKKRGLPRQYGLSPIELKQLENKNKKFFMTASPFEILKQLKQWDKI